MLYRNLINIRRRNEVINDDVRQKLSGTVTVVEIIRRKKVVTVWSHVPNV